LIWNKEELSSQCKELIFVSIPKRGDKTECGNYQGVSLLPPLCKILSNFLLSSLIPYADEVIGDHQCGFRCNRLKTDQILEKKREHNGTVHQLFIDFKKAYDSIRREVLYSTLSEFGIPRKLVGLIKMCLNETCSRVCIGKICLTSLLFRMA
jgi:hypothetical protein